MRHYKALIIIVQIEKRLACTSDKFIHSFIFMY